MKIIKYPKMSYMPGENVLKCQTCKAIIEYEESDFKLGERYFGEEEQKYIECPFCFDKLLWKDDD